MLRAASLTLALLLVTAGCRPGEPLPEIAAVPAFQMRDQDGQPFTERELGTPRGRQGAPRKKVVLPDG